MEKMHLVQEPHHQEQRQQEPKRSPRKSPQRSPSQLEEGELESWSRSKSRSSGGGGSSNETMRFRDDRLYRKIEMIGKGTYGFVFKARDPSNQLVALKKIVMESEDQGFPITAIREIRILQRLNHPNVIALQDVVATRDAAQHRRESGVLLVFPFMDHDLTGLLENPQARFELPHIKCYLKQLLQGLCYVHHHRIIHRDVKGPNVLLNNRGQVKLADFGLARKLLPDVDLTSNVVTLWFRAPELLLGAVRYGPAIDMWAVGCVLAELLARRPPFPGKTEIEQLELIFRVCGSPSEEQWQALNRIKGVVQELRPREQNYVSRLDQMFGQDRAALDLLRRLFEYDPAKRITAHEALDHAFFWEEPQPCAPADLPQYAASHEYTARQRREQRHRRYHHHHHHHNHHNPHHHHHRHHSHRRAQSHSEQNPRPSKRARPHHQ